MPQASGTLFLQNCCCLAAKISFFSDLAIILYVKNVIFTGGCSGNTQGVAALAKGMKVDEVIERLKDIKCGAKPTSCPAQLAKSLQEHAK